jgi:hypothetical protein
MPAVARRASPALGAHRAAKSAEFLPSLTGPLAVSVDRAA